MTGMMRDIENREEGLQEGLRHVVANMLAKGKSIEEIADLCGYPLEQISKIIEECDGNQIVK